jgi:penicillin-binding protein 1C
MIGLGSALIAVVQIWRAPVPEVLLRERPEQSVRVLDRRGRLIREVRRSDGSFAQPVRLDELSPYVVPALLAAEDARFYQHFGVDPWAMGRAAVQAVWQRRIVSGASTLTQQLARTVQPRSRDLRGKWSEILSALAIERALPKERILSEYLNRVEFGPNVRGIEAASRRYFDKSARQLSLAEAAALVSIPRGPTLYDPERGLERVRRRRDRVLGRMHDHDLAEAAAIRRALAEPIRLQVRASENTAWHFTRAVTTRLLPRSLERGQVSELRTTLDASLQREVETLVRDTVGRLRSYDASAAAVLVVDNANGDVLAYVGAPDFFSAAALGQNDGVLALRQPGSALKPFVYALALERGMTPASLLPDIELHFPSGEGDYSPRNYDGRFHGPVRMREALASSLNVPAVYLADRLGVPAVLELLRAVGFDSLSRDAHHYGAALALGDGEVRLDELASAYATLANGGTRTPLRFVLGARDAKGTRSAFPEVRGPRVIQRIAAEQITHVLADDLARAASFGRDSALAFSFPVAAKTGTSKGFRDNWAVGYTRARTVAVWVGNFDGRPMRGSSGITGAGPLFHAAMQAAMCGLVPEPLFAADAYAAREICPLSGLLAAADCPHRALEHFAPSSAPTAPCTMHVRIAVDPDNGLRAGPACAGAVSPVFESYPQQFISWATSAGRPVAPAEWSPRCRSVPFGESELAPGVAYPADGSKFFIDPSLSPEQQQIVFVGRAASGGLRFVLNGRVVPGAAARRVAWPLTRGRHVLHVEDTAGRASDAINFDVF